MFQEAVPLPIYTKTDYIHYGNRLHINFAIDTLINGFAAYIVLKHSTKAMGIYKYYILSTIISAFLVDFHLTVIYGPLPLIPSPIACSAGLLSRHLNKFWGNAIQWMTIQILFGAVGGSIICSFFYQYFSLNGNTYFFRSIKGAVILTSISLLYPLPSMTIFLISYDEKASEEWIKQEYPQYHELYVSAPCFSTQMNPLGMVQYIAIVVEVAAVWVIGVVIGTKIGRKIDSMKHVLSPSTLKARRQLLISLACQAIVPSGLLVAPVILLFGGILLKFVQLNVMSQLLVHVISLHSTANALSIIWVITPYRNAVINGFKTLFGIKRKNSTVLAMNSTTILQ